MFTEFHVFPYLSNRSRLFHSSRRVMCRRFADKNAATQLERHVRACVSVVRQALLKKDCLMNYIKALIPAMALSVAFASATAMAQTTPTSSSQQSTPATNSDQMSNKTDGSMSSNSMDKNGSKTMKHKKPSTSGSMSNGSMKSDNSMKSEGAMKSDGSMKSDDSMKSGNAMGAPASGSSTH